VGYADFVIPVVTAAKTLRHEIIGRSESQSVQNGQGIVVDIAIAIVKRDADHLSLFFAAYIGQQIAHGQATITQPAQPGHLAPEIIGMNGQATKWRPLWRGLPDLMVHEDGNHARHYTWLQNVRRRQPASTC